MATAVLNQPVPFATRRYLPEPRTLLPNGCWLDRLQDPLYGSPFKGTVWDNDAIVWPGDGVLGVDYNLVATITAASSPNPSAALTAAVTASKAIHNPVIEVQAGLTVTGPFTWPVNDFGDRLEIRTTEWALLSPDSVHFDAANDTAHCFTMRNQNVANGIAFRYANQAAKIRITGMRSQLNTGAGRQTATWCYIGPSTLTTLANKCSELVFRKCCTDVDPASTDARRWAMVQAVDKCALIGCDVLGWHSSDASDAQGIYLNHGVTKFKGINVRAQAGGEPWFYGGGSPLPSDDPAWVNDDIEWRGLISSSYPEDGSAVAANAKNVGEGKSGRRVLVTDFVLRHLFEKGQDKALILKNVWDGTQGGAHNESSDITLWFGRIVDVCGVFGVIGKETFTGTWPLSPLTRVDARFILADRLDIAPYDFLPAGGRHLMIIGNNPVDVTMDHWTIACGSGDAPRATGLLALSQNASAGSYSCDGLNITNSVFPQLTYGVLASSVAEGNAALATANRVVWRKNLLYRRPGGSTATTYPATTSFVASQAAAMPLFSIGDYTVDTPYQGTADDGLDYGAMPAWVLARTGLPGAILYGAMSKPLPLGFSATGSGQVTGAFSKALPLRAGFSSSGSVQVTAALNKALPLTLTAEGGTPLTITASLAKAVPFALTATASPTVSAALSKAVPFTLTATASPTVSAALNKALPLNLTAFASIENSVVVAFLMAVPLALAIAASVQVTAAVSAPLPFAVTSSASAQVTGALDASLPVALAADALVGIGIDFDAGIPFSFASTVSVQPVVETALLLFADAGDIDTRFTDRSRYTWRFTDTSDPDYFLE